MSKSIPVRSACDPQYQWTLTDIFPSDADWHSCYAKVKDSLDSLRGYRGAYSTDNADTLLSYLELGDRLGRSLDALANYAQRKSDEDTRNAVYQEMTTQFTNLAVAVNQADAFSTPELLAIPDDVLHDFYAACPNSPITAYSSTGSADSVRTRSPPNVRRCLPLPVSSVRLLMKFFLCSMMQTCSFRTLWTAASSPIRSHMGRLSPCCNPVTVPCAKTLLNPFTMSTSSFETPLLRF